MSSSALPGSARFAFAGSPVFAATILQHLLTHDLRPVLVLTQPDRPAGRGRRLQPSPVKSLAHTHGLTLAQPTSLKLAATQAMLREYQLDLMIVAAYGKILPSAVLSLPRRGCVNVHASLLPRWRGAAPVERAIMAGDVVTGVCLMQMDAGLDTGAVLARAELAIGADESGVELEQRLTDLGGALLVQTLPAILAGAVTVQEQPTLGITYAHKLNAADAALDLSKSAAELSRQVRALAGRLNPFLQFSDGERVILTRALAVPSVAPASIGTIVQADRHGIVVVCGDGCLRIEGLRLTRGQGKLLNPAAALNGYPELFAAGRCFYVAH